jgi:c-di-GMP-binding flagellar brake protein YcgR
MDENPGMERRRFRRVRCLSPVEYRFVNDDKYHYGVTCDISEGGVSFKVDGSVPIGTHLYFRVKLRNRPQAILGIARVAWSAPEPYSEQYRLGLEFIEVNSVNKEDISTYIQENKSSFYSS